MTDMKYGRIFVEADLKILAGLVGIDSKVFEAKLEALPTRFPKDEPLFVLRAQDIAAADTINDYYNNCEDVGCDDEHLEGVTKAYTAFVNWNDEHELKIPDTKRGDDL